MRSRKKPAAVKEYGQLVRTVRYRGKHDLEQRFYAREIQELWCRRKGCRFRGQRAQQGICFTHYNWLGEPFDSERSYQNKLYRAAYKAWAELRSCRPKHRSLKDQNAHLQSEVFCMWMNNITGLDQLVMLRRKLAIAEDKLRRLRQKGGRRA